MSGTATVVATESDVPSRFVVGVDLGTTNSAVGYIDTHEQPWQIRTLALPQIVAPFQVENRETLPSFHYQGTPSEATSGALRLPWSEGDPAYAVGVFARDEGIAKPGRLIASAKSWLSHSGVDRTAELLPWQGDTDVERLSPVTASARYLEHIHAAWNQQFPDHPLAEQDVVLTLPASFDEVARELTVESARQALLPRLVLIEEPQAAFYAWVHRHAENWHEHISAGQKILVCDIGGGTTDFTLIRASASETSGDVQFHRVAVGEHLILGGDNLDLALARHVERKLAGGDKLPAQQWDVLVRAARRVKETLLGENPPDSATIHLPASGAKVIGGGLQVAVTREEVVQLLVEGFLPTVAFGEQPARRQSGFQDFGLPYAADPAITRYLAAFLSAHRFTGDDRPPTNWESQHASDPARPDIVLFNGGFFASPVLRGRLLEVLASWFAEQDPGWSPLVLDNPRLDLAVAHGAAYYGMVRRGEGVGIVATLARSYYIGVAGDRPRAVCLAPGSATTGQDFEIDTTFELTLAEPVEFPLYVSSTRLVDPPGAIIDIDLEEVTPLPPIRTVLHTGRRRQPETAKVRLHAHLSEVGVLELSCREVEGHRRWRLQFDVRSTTQTDRHAHQSEAEGEGFVDEKLVAACRTQIERVFGAGGNEKPAALMKGLTHAIVMPKHEWPTSLLRRIWEVLMEVEAGRRRSAAHEARWLNLVGYTLRPGYGFAVDDWRVAETWRAVQGKVAFASSAPETLVLWRRIAGGLSSGQQLQLAEPLLAAVRAVRKRFRGEHATGSSSTLDPVQSAELWRLLGALELLPVPLKIELGDTIVELLPKRKLEKQRLTMLWALGRLGQRVPLHGPLNMLVPTAHAVRWLEAVLKHDQTERTTQLAAMQLARRTDDRHRDVPTDVRERTAEWLEQGGAASHLVELVRAGGMLDQEEQGAVFGESLPSGLKLA